MAFPHPVQEGPVVRLPNPAGDLMRRVDTTLENVDDVLGRVDTSLAEVTSVLTDVRGLLGELTAEMALVHQLPEIAAQIQTIADVVQRLDGGRPE
jgi:hypothetical protein